MLWHACDKIIFSLSLSVCPYCILCFSDSLHVHILVQKISVDFFTECMDFIDIGKTASIDLAELHIFPWPLLPFCPGFVASAFPCHVSIRLCGWEPWKEMCKVSLRSWRQPRPQPKKVRLLFGAFNGCRKAMRNWLSVTRTRWCSCMWPWNELVEKLLGSVHMLGWRQRHVQTTLLKQNFYVVPRRGRENLLQDMKEYLVDPCDLPDLPVTFDPKESFILDDAAPRGKLGLGVTIMELSAGTQRDRSTSVPVQQAQKSVEGGDKVEALSAADRPMASVPVQGCCFDWKAFVQSLAIATLRGNDRKRCRGNHCREHQESFRQWQTTFRRCISSPTQWHFGWPATRSIWWPNYRHSRSPTMKLTQRSSFLAQAVINFSYLWFGANFSIQSYIALCLSNSNLFLLLVT